MSTHTLRKNSCKKLVSQIEKHRAVLIKTRDELRELISEVESLENSADDAQQRLYEAVNYVKCAAEDISRYV